MIGSQETVYGQFSTLNKDSCICYTTNQDKRALECLKTSTDKDSLIANSLVRINGYKSVLDKNSKIISLNNDMIKDQGKRIKLLNVKLKISKRLAFVGTPLALIGGLFVGMNLK